MRVALISDIHGNGTALRAILAALDGRGVDDILCLGDLCCGGPEPGECLRLMAENARWCVAGNTDETLLRYRRARPREAAAFDEEVRWTAGSLTDSQWDYLSALPLSLPLCLGRYRLEAFHGSPDSAQREWMADDFVLWAREQDVPALAACGHTHRPMMLFDGEAGFLNPGSVGITQIKRQGVKTRLPLARAMILDISRELSIQFIETSFDRDELGRSIGRSAMPGAEHQLRRWGLA